MNDAALRKAVKQRVLARYSGSAAGALVFEEVGLRHGSGRIDLIVVDGILHGFELKSDRDNLSRLPHQIEIYNSVLDKVTLVVGSRHVDKAAELVPLGWGIKVATAGVRGGIRFSDLRKAQLNGLVDPVKVAKLLWRDEALELLTELGAESGVRSKARLFIYERLASVADLKVIRMRVCRQMRERKKWLVPVF